MPNLTRGSFVKSLLAVPVLPLEANGLSVSEKPICGAKGKINPVDAAFLMEKYGLALIKGTPDTYDFYIGKKRYRYGFFSCVAILGLKLATKERHRIITSFSRNRTTIQAVKIGGEWRFPTGSCFPRDFPIHML